MSIRPRSGPLVSIIIPCFNAEKWIGLCVNSALQQTYLNTEIIVVDDGSSDGSVEVLKSYGNSVRWVTGKNKGPSNARNIGFQMSKGDWIQYLDADDLLHPQKLELSVFAASKFPDADFVWAPHSSICENSQVPVTYSQIYSESAVVNELGISALDAQYAPWAAFFKREFLERVGPWNEDLRRWNDLEYHARIAVQTDHFVRTDTPLYFYRQHSGDRISDANRDNTKIEHAVASLSLARSALEKGGVPASEWKAWLAPFYLHLAKSTAKVGDEHMFRELLHVAADFRGSDKFRLKCALANASVSAFGIRRTSSLIEWALRSTKNMG